MRLSTTTSMFGGRLSGEFTTYAESIRRCKEAGYNVVDINFCAAINNETDLAKENWESIMYDLRNEAEKLGVEFTQSHPVFLLGHIKHHPEELQQFFYKMMERSLIASSILGVKWAILHPLAVSQEMVQDMEASVKENVEQYASIVDQAMKLDVGIAFENMIEHKNGNRRFCSKAEELAALIDAYQDPKVGACWDFGHANFIYEDQRDALRILGKRLKATHVNDNYGSADEHMYPFHGSVDWHSLLPVLSEIEYEGDFTYESTKEVYRLPEHLKDPVAKLGVEIGQYCLQIVEGRVEMKVGRTELNKW